MSPLSGRVSDHKYHIKNGETLVFLFLPIGRQGLNLLRVASLLGLKPDNQILSERITGQVGRAGGMKIETVSWSDEEIVGKLGALRDRYAGAQIYLTGSIEVEEGDEVRYVGRPYELVTLVRRGNRVELNSCPLGEAIGVLGEQWGTGQVRVRIVG
jgi:hypothetical protein